jgi:hypothetical protein
MIDPNYLTTWAQATPSRRYGNHYRAAFEMSGYAQFSRRRLKSKDQADQYGQRVIERWKRLYRARMVRAAWIEEKVT